MIEEISIENVGVIASARLELGPGFTVITGETGAGKTMVLTGLDLLLGGRGDPAVVRTGTDRAVVEGTFVVDEDVARRVEESGGTLDDDALILARTLPAQGRSRSFAGGRSVPQAFLAELAADLVTVHGQSDQLRLRAPARQRALLDSFARTGALLTDYRGTWQRLTDARTRLEEWQARSDERAGEAARLRAGLELLEALDPQPGEDDELRAEAEKLGNVEELREAAGRAHAALSGAGEGAELDATVLVDEARRSLEVSDPELSALAARLAEVAYLLADIGTDVGAFLASLEADPTRLQTVHERRAALKDAALRLGVEGPDALTEWSAAAAARLAEIDGPQDGGAALREELASLTARLEALAAELTAARTEAAARLSAAVDAELAGLAMPGAHLDVALTPLPEPGPWGAESVALLLQPRPDARPRPLGDGASGGELSRVMLALEVAVAAPDTAPAVRPTFVFDEVDAGVGGKAAIEVGRRLAGLARVAQVVVVTHLPQVAAFADTHLVVTKSTGEATVTDVRRVTGAEREQELARMLSGQEDSDVARRHAAELLDRAVMAP
ncbi:DNA repair protein RecN [Georgenia wutianyii]|uniref:DNA repair protein RecN n=1 Tax=Georgenia wutianyii TaxID=2585135 RepID=A0ABX5VMN2_9MICO|nr:DNA repair protein RecN [Georgenia wutianyii]QDB79764.1 DNA repair protein RecN [Georgenia wutianyii]